MAFPIYPVCQSLISYSNGLVFVTSRCFFWAGNPPRAKSLSGYGSNLGTNGPENFGIFQGSTIRLLGSILTQTQAINYIYISSGNLT